MVDSPAHERGSGRNPARRRGGDTPIYAAMAVVTAAAGVGMFLQLGLAGWLSIVAALSLFLTMFSLHQLGQRSGEIAELRDEVRRLETEMRRVPPRSSSAAAGQNAAQNAPPPTPPPLGPASRQARVEAALRPAHNDEPPAPTLRPEQMRREPQRPEMGRSERQPPSLAPIPPPQPASAPARDPQPVAVPAAAAEAGSPRDPWGFRPADANRPAPVEADAATRAPVAAAPPMQAPPLQARPSSAEPAAANGGNVRDTDVEVIQGLIKKLADEVNAHDTAPDAKRHPANTMTDTAIESSLEALRTTAGSMRSREEAAGLAKRREPARQEPPPLAIRPQAQPSGGQTGNPPSARAPQLPPAAPPPAAAPPAARPAMTARPVPAHESDPAADTADAWLDADLPDAGGDPRLAALREAITAGRADVFLEPILTLVDQRPRHYEVQVRPKSLDGDTFPDGADLHTLLDGSGLLPVLDRTRISRVALIARRLAERGRDSSIFSGFSGESLVDDDFLNDFANAFHERDSFANQLVLTFALSDVRAITAREQSALEDMRDLGFRFAIDHVTDLDVDFEDLRRNGFQFIKLDANVFLQGLPASGGLIPASDICRHLAQLGMTLIVGDIEDESKFARIFGFGVLFGQGQLFGGPRLVKAEPQPARRTAAA